MKYEQLKKLYCSPITDKNHGLNINPNYPTPVENTVELVKHLHSFSEQEQIYKKYNTIKKDPDVVKKFLESLDPETILKWSLQFPDEGLRSQEPVNHPYMEKAFFDNQYFFDVALIKHPRYTPYLPHNHAFFEAVYVLEGELSHTVSNRTFHMKAGDFCILAPEVIHCLFVFDDQTIAINLLIRCSTFEDIFFHLLHGDNVLSFFFLNNIRAKNMSEYILFHTGNDSSIREMILELFLEYINKKPYFSEVLNAELTTFFAKLLRSYGSSYELPPTIKKKRIQSFELISHIQDNFQTVCLEEIATHFHYTVPYTSSIIKETTGYTFTQLLLHIRMNRASALLKNTDLTVNKICEDLGYLNPEHFIRTFKKYYNCTPSEYRAASKRKQPS